MKAALTRLVSPGTKPVSLLLKTMRRNHAAIWGEGCTEMTEYILSVMLIYWGASLDVSASPHYTFLQPHPWIWRGIALVIGTVRLSSVLLGGKPYRMVLGFLQFGFLVTIGVGFLWSGWYAAGLHLFFALVSVWTVKRINSRLDNREAHIDFLQVAGETNDG